MTDPLGALDPVRTALLAELPRARADLAALVAHRSVADPDVEPVSECRAAAASVAALYADLGLSPEVLDAADGSRAVVARSGADGPTCLLYSHYDVVPAGPLSSWTSSPWELTERDGRWYGRGAADCKGNLMAELLALRVLRSVIGADLSSWPFAVALVCEGSEEQSSGGLEALARSRPSLVEAGSIVIADAGNVAAGVPTLTTSLRGTGSVLVTVTTMERPAHSGMYGGAAPDALQALLTGLASLRAPDGETTIDGLPADGVWTGAPYPPDRFATDAAVLPGVAPLTGSGSIADRLWARPAATVLAIDAPSVAELTAAVSPSARAVVNLRVPPGMDPADAQSLLTAHLRAHIPYGVVEVSALSLGRPFRADTSGPAYAAMRSAMTSAYGREPVEAGQGGSIPLAVTLAELNPDAEIMLLGVEEPASAIHSPDESVSPVELQRTALSLALFLASLG